MKLLLFYLIIFLGGNVIADNKSQEDNLLNIKSFSKKIRQKDELLKVSINQNKKLIDLLEEIEKENREKDFLIQELSYKLEATGLASSFLDSKSSESMILKSIKDISLVRSEIQTLKSYCFNVISVLMPYVSVDSDVKRKNKNLNIVNKIKKKIQYFNNKTNENRSKIVKTSSNVIGYKKDVGLVVFDSGSNENVSIGDHVLIQRNNNDIYTAFVVDVRPFIAGAFLEDKIGIGFGVENVKIGDKVRFLSK